MIVRTFQYPFLHWKRLGSAFCFSHGDDALFQSRNNRLVTRKNSHLSGRTRKRYRYCITVEFRAFYRGNDETKGLHVVIKALAREHRLNLKLDIYGVKQGETWNSYAEQLFKMVRNDIRIQILPMLPQSQIVQTLRSYDALLVSSQWMETGPMVVLEAFAAGIPVIGSDLGGIRDFVRHDVDGILVPFNNIEKWIHAFKNISEDPAVLQRLKENVKAPETMQIVAGRMQAIYKQVLVSSN